jgi:hypothetical protein
MYAMIAHMARRPFAISSESWVVSQPGPRSQPAPARREHAEDRHHGQAADRDLPEANRRPHAENMPMIAIMARRPFAISLRNFSVFAAGSQKPPGEAFME